MYNGNEPKVYLYTNDQTILIITYKILLHTYMQTHDHGHTAISHHHISKYICVCQQYGLPNFYLHT